MESNNKKKEGEKGRKCNKKKRKMKWKQKGKKRGENGEEKCAKSQ